MSYNAFMAKCPTRQVMATMGDKWASLTINALADGPQRHGQLATTIAGASQKMLTQTLRTLERDGLVTRTVTPTVPVRVDYELTAPRAEPRARHASPQGVVRDQHRGDHRRARGVRLQARRRLSGLDEA